MKAKLFYKQNKSFAISWSLIMEDTEKKGWDFVLVKTKVKNFNFDRSISFCFGVSSNSSQQKSPTAEILRI